MSPLYVGCLTVIVILIILLIIQRRQAFSRPITPTLTAAQLSASYTIPSLWETHGGLKGDTCASYTFVASDADNSARPTLSSVKSCLASGSCLRDENASCIDADQILAQRLSRTCRYGDFTIANISEYSGCRTRDGEYVKINGFYEEYYATCKPLGQTQNNQTIKCPGSLSLITFNLTPNGLNSSKCLSTPSYTYSSANKISLPANSTVNLQTCQANATYLNYPAQLFRVIRATYSQNGFTLAQTAPWVQIVHRQSSRILAPYCLSNNVAKLEAVNYTQPPIVVESNSLNSDGYWWFLTGTLSGKVKADYVLNQLIANQQITAQELIYFKQNRLETIPVQAQPQLLFVPVAKSWPKSPTIEQIIKASTYVLATNLDNTALQLRPFSVYAGSPPDKRPDSSNYNLNNSEAQAAYGLLVVIYEASRLSRSSNFQYVDTTLIANINAHPSQYT